MRRSRAVDWRGPQTWSAYARFNLGVALVRNGRLTDADPFLTGVGTLLPQLRSWRRSRTAPISRLALRAAGQPAGAGAPALARVRLTGPYSNKALLGIGWAERRSGLPGGAHAVAGAARP